MKWSAGLILPGVIALTLILAVPATSDAGRHPRAYAAGKYDGGHYGYKGGHRRVHEYKRVHGRWGYSRRAWGPRWVVSFGWRGPLWWGPPWYAPGYYRTPPVVVQQQPPVYVQPQPQPEYWYYCRNPQGYYPYIQSCPGGWMRVVPETTPPNP